MGQNHVRVLSQIPECDFVGIYDVDKFRARQICELYNCQGFENLDQMLKKVDAIIIAAPTSFHGNLGQKCFDHDVHVLMEKPLAANLFEAENLVRVSQRNDLILMVGHIERYNPAVSLMIDKIAQNQEPLVSFEARRLNPFDGSRCMDVDVLYDLLIHDIDLALEIVGCEISDVWAIGKTVYSKLVDDAHTLIRFNNGASASFWTSKCSPRKIREINVTTRSRFYHADTIARCLTIYTAKDLNPNKGGVCLMGDVVVEEISQPQLEPLKLEIEDFLRSITNNSSPITNGQRALDSLIILDKISQSLNQQAGSQEIIEIKVS